MPSRSTFRNTLLIASFALSFSGTAAGAQMLQQNTSNSYSQNDMASPAGAAASDDQLRQSVDSLVKSRMQQFNIPGYAITVVKNGKIILQNSYGFASIEQSRPVTNQTVFGLASITKTFTAFVILTLVDRGLVNLDDPLQKYVSNLTPEYKGLTIRQLASMCAGVTNKLPRERPWPQQLDDIIATPLVSQPGSTYLYSNFSYRLLGQVIENVTGKSYMQNVSETIFQPFGMGTSGTPVTLAPTGLVAQPYGDQNGAAPLRPIQYKPPIVAFSAGMLASNSDDMLRYTLALMNRQGLSETGFKTLWYDRPPLSTGEPSHWAFGWGSKMSAAYGGKRSVSMNGGIPGVASTIIMLPEEQSAVIALCNLRKPPVYAIATSVAKLAFGRPSQTALDNEMEADQNNGASED